MNKLTRLAPTGLVVLALALGGCTNASQEESNGPDAGATATAQTNEALINSIKKDDAIAKLVPADIAKKGTLTNGAAANYAPAEFMDADGSTVIGYDVDYARAMGKLMGLNVTTTNADFPTLIPALGSKFDMSVSSFTITAERQKQINMVSYFKAGFGMAVRKGNPKKVSADSLCGFTVAVQTGTAQETAAGQKSKECTAAGKKAIDVLSYKSQSDAATNVVGGKADVAFADSMIIDYAIQKSNGALEPLGGMTDAALFGVATAKSDMPLAKAIQAATQKLIDNGDMKKILASWGNENGLIVKSEINPAVK
jgi:polar amino acid transport system substrate-binding protein